MCPLKGIEATRRRRNRTFQAVGCTALLVLKAGRFVPENRPVATAVATGSLTITIQVGIQQVPRLVLRPDREGIVALPFGSRRPPRVLALAWHKDRYRSPAAERFVELAGELADELRSNE